MFKWFELYSRWVPLSPRRAGGWLYLGIARQDKTIQDNVLFGVLYSLMYIDFIQII